MIGYSANICELYTACSALMRRGIIESIAKSAAYYPMWLLITAKIITYYHDPGLLCAARGTTRNQIRCGTALEIAEELAPSINYFPEYRRIAPAAGANCTCGVLFLSDVFPTRFSRNIKFAARTSRSIATAPTAGGGGALLTPATHRYFRRVYSFRAINRGD